ncbi:MAG: phosphatase PAP2 family protein [Rhodobacterales bacterium]|nr:phosphatase PAP2 family protein [Rhodobacterales bacterium]
MDLTLAQTLNQVVGHSITFDALLDFVQESYLVKGLFAACILVMILSARTADDTVRRTNVYTTLILVFAAIFLGRILQMVLPFSPRPLHTDGLDLVLAGDLRADVLEHDSSYPSDHALMFFAMASSVLIYHRQAGVVLMLHALVVISLPRLILGFHWASDIIAGAIIGGVIAVLLHRPVARWLSRTGLAAFQANHPAVFSALLFALLCETATMYRGSRQIISEAAHFAHLVM